MSGYLNHAKMAYTIEEACELVSLSRAQLYRLIDLQEIGSIKVGRARRITSRQLDVFLSQQEGRSGPVQRTGRT
jgi:excisionase family DNA binding protein